MSNIKTYTAKASFFNDSEVTLQVDHDILTPELAKEINDFWSDNEYRLDEENQDVVRAVIRLFGTRAIAVAMKQGWDFSFRSYEDGIRNAADVIEHDGEGWPKAEELGIAITDAVGYIVGFDDVQLEAA
jgi:hypothetical protein